MMFHDLPTKALNLNVALLQVAEKLNERGVPSVAKYILKHGVRASDYLHRSRRNTSKYKCITNFKTAIYELDKAKCLIDHLYKRGLMTDEEYMYINEKYTSVRMSTFVEISRYSKVADWYNFGDEDSFI